VTVARRHAREGFEFTIGVIMDEEAKRYVESLVRWGNAHFLPVPDSLNLEQFPNALVLGFAMWSGPDREAVRELLRTSTWGGRDLFFFSLDDCLTLQELGQFMPGVGVGQRPSRSPFLAVYGGGYLEAFYQGSDAVETIASGADRG